MLLLGGGAETIFHHMNAHGVNLKLKNREALNVLHLRDIKHNCESANGNVNASMAKIAGLIELYPAEAKAMTSEVIGVELGL